jgi:hypothetical protein
MKSKHVATRKSAAVAAAKKSPVRKGSKKPTPPKAAVKAATPRRASKPTDRDPRLPAIGTTITRHYKGRDLKIKVLADGFELDGQHFSSLSALAKHVVGYGVSGFAFVGLWKQAGDAATEGK